MTLLLQNELGAGPAGSSQVRGEIDGRRPGATIEGPGGNAESSAAGEREGFQPIVNGIPCVAGKAAESVAVTEIGLLSALTQGQGQPVRSSQVRVGLGDRVRFRIRLPQVLPKFVDTVEQIAPLSVVAPVPVEVLTMGDDQCGCQRTLIGEAPATAQPDLATQLVGDRSIVVDAAVVRQLGGGVGLLPTVVVLARRPQDLVPPAMFGDSTTPPQRQQFRGQSGVVVLGYNAQAAVALGDDHRVTDLLS